MGEPTPSCSRTSVTCYQPHEIAHLANLRALNWVIWDEGLIARNGHRVCWELEKGSTPWAVQQEMVNAGESLRAAQEFVVTAMQTYPACP